jgi:hypothetical protein
MPSGDDRSFVARGVATVSVATLPAVDLHKLWLMINAGKESGLSPDAPPSIMRTVHTADDQIER